MKTQIKTLYTFSVLCFFSLSSVAQPNLKQYPNYSVSSGFELKGEITESQIDNIEVLGRVWGFVKYHHPVFCDSTYNADLELFGLLPRIYNTSLSERNEVLLQWIKSLGEYDKFDYDTSQYVCMNNFRWISDISVLGSELSYELQKMRFAERTQNQYVTQTDVNVLFNESPYAELNTDKIDYGYRLLGVIRYWNIVDSYSPNRNITDINWSEVLGKYIKKAVDAEMDIPRLFAELISELDDTHAYTPNTQILGSSMAPIVAKYAEDRMFVTDTCSWEYGSFAIGDEIVSIGGIRPIDKVKEVAKYTSHSNHASLLRDASYMALLTKDSLVNIEYIHNGITHKAAISTVFIGDFVAHIYSNLFPSPKQALKFINGEIAYINIGGLKSEDSQVIYDSIKNVENLIIDMRTYPADYNVKTEFLGRFFASEPCNFIKTLCPIAVMPGFFSEAASLNSDQNNTNAFKGRVVVLANAQTQSMGEYFVMLSQSLSNTVTIGNCTAGAVGNISKITFPYNIASCISGLGVYYPDGTNVQRTGVKIDYVVEPTANGLKEGKDEVLDKAISLLKCR